MTVTVGDARPHLVAGIDSSTQACKAQLRDAETGELVATGTAPHPPTSPPVSEQDPADWWSALRTAFGRAAKVAGASPDAIRAVSIGAQCHGLVVSDAADRVLRPAKLWNDTTSSPQIAALRRAIGDESFVRRTGSRPTAAFTISKLAWLRENDPGAYAETRSIMLPHDHLTWRLTGRRTTDRSEASGTGYFDADAMEYLDGFLRHVDPDRDLTAMLPEVLLPTEIAGEVTAAAAAELPVRPGAIVGIGGGDQHVSALGLGVGPGDVVYSFGTSGVVFARHPDPVRDELGIVDGVADCTGGYLPLVCTLNSAKVIVTFARLLGVDLAELSALALAADPATTGPSLAAFLDGERKPDRPAAAGMLSGLTNATTREEVARAAFEGVILGLVSGQRSMEASGVDTSGRVIAIGGGARSDAMVQLLADVLDRPVLRADASEVVARGAAVQAAAALTGRPVQEVAREWAPPTTVAATPRGPTRDPLPDYAATVAHLGPREKGVTS